MPNNNDEKTSKLVVSLKPINSSYTKPERKNELVDPTKYEKIDSDIAELAKIGTNGVLYVSEDAFPRIFQTTKAKGSYIFENQIPESDKKNFDGTSYAHSSAVVGLADKKAQEVRDADKQALLQYARDSLICISDSPEAQDIRRKLDSFTNKELPKLRGERGIDIDEVTGEERKKGFAFHHVNPKELHTDPEDILDPSKGRNVNHDTHVDIHRKGINDENQFEEYRLKYQSQKDE